jgi:hypothetical protein
VSVVEAYKVVNSPLEASVHSQYFYGR